MITPKSTPTHKIALYYIRDFMLGNRRNMDKSQSVPPAVHDFFFYRFRFRKIMINACNIHVISTVSKFVFNHCSLFVYIVLQGKKNSNIIRIFYNRWSCRYLYINIILYNCASVRIAIANDILATVYTQRIAV